LTSAENIVTRVKSDHGNADSAKLFGCHPNQYANDCNPLGGGGDDDAVTGPTLALVALFEPPSFVAVTTERIVCPTSFALST
jgi:hypothetical protein